MSYAKMFATLVMTNGYRTNAPFVLALNNQRCLFMSSRVVVLHRVMPRCIVQELLFLFELVRYA